MQTKYIYQSEIKEQWYEYEKQKSRKKLLTNPEWNQEELATKDCTFYCHPALSF